MIKQRYSLSFILICIITIVVLITSAIFTFLIVQYRTNDLIALADTKLFTAAELNREMIGPDYHDRIINKSSVSQDEFRRIIERNDSLCRRLDIQYLWSVLLIENRVVFTSATHSDLNNPESHCASFFETHHDPASFNTALNPEMKPVYSTFNNEWGTGRMVLIPWEDMKGRTYIFGASIQLSELDETVHNCIIYSLGIVLGIITITIFFSILLARAVTVPITRLTKAANRMATGDLDTPLVTANTRELQSLSTSLNQMRLGLKHHISALRESEEKYRRLFESMTDAFVQTEMDGTIVESNRSFQLMTGYSGEELRSMSYIDITPPEWNGLEDRIIKNQIIPLGYSEVYRKEYRRKDGIIIPVELRTFLLQNQNGESTGMWAIVRDITERKQAEEELRTSNDLVNMTQDAVGAGSWDWDIKTGKLRWSPMMFKLFGLDQTEHSATFDTWRSLLHPDDSETAESRIATAIENHEYLRNEYRIITPDGNQLWINALGNCFYDEQDQPYRMIGICLDITRQKLAEEEIKFTRDKLDYALHTVNIGAWELSLIDSTAWRSLEHDQIFGYKTLLPEWTFDMFMEHIIPEDRDQVKTKFQNALSTGTEWNFECRIRRTDGVIRWIWAKGNQVYNKKNKPVTMFGIVQDITPHKLAEDQIINLLHEKEYILREVHHRIKNNMNTISGLLTLQAELQDNNRIKDVLHDASGRVQSMMILYDRLYRNELTGGLSIKDYLPSLIDQISAIFPLNKLITFNTQIDDIVLDPKILSLIGIIINELITNSMKYAFKKRKDGIITLSASKRENRLVIIFEDNGSGIPESVTLENSSGFGMQLVDLLVKQMNGSVKIERDNGTRFVIEFEC